MTNFYNNRYETQPEPQLIPPFLKQNHKLEMLTYMMNALLALEKNPK